MPRYSERRGCNLLAVNECAQVAGKSSKTIKRWMKKPGVYVEYHQVPTSSGNSVRAAFIDPHTLPHGGTNLDVPPLAHGGTSRRDIDLTEGHANKSSSETQEKDTERENSQFTEGHKDSVPPLANEPLKSEPLKSSDCQVQIATESSDCQTREARSTQGKPAEVAEKGKSSDCQSDLAIRTPETSYEYDLEQAQTRLELLRPILAMKKQKRARAIAALAKAERVTPKTVYRWLEDFEQQGIKALGRKARRDQGKPRIPPHSYDLIVRGLVSNSVNASAKMVHRTLLRAAPSLMRYERGEQQVFVSASTVQRIKDDLLHDPHSRLLFYDADKKKEFLRTWAGAVYSAHANDMWQMDMTRCDTEVLWIDEAPDGTLSFDTQRPRIHYLIDVYSGCIPGLAFSRKEDQAQTDWAILNAIRPKQGPYAERYPIYGVPKRFYADNGKTYVSEHTHRYLAALGVEVFHSVPKTSHTRGKVERSFGSVHNFEKALPGYVGKDASERATEELKRLRKNTLAWAQRGFERDPGDGNRLLTINEYQSYVVAWLISDYHSLMVDGKSRLEHFQETAERQWLIDEADIFRAMAKRVQRRVEGNGMIRFNNRRWAIPDGSLISYQGLKVWALQDHIFGSERLLICFEDRFGKFNELGWAVPAPTIADSIEAQDYRRNSKAQAKRDLQRARESYGETADLNLRIPQVLAKEAAAVVEAVPPAQRARLAANNPSDPKDDLDPTDEFAQFLSETPKYGTDDPAEFFKASRAAIKSRHKGDKRE